LNFIGGVLGGSGADPTKDAGCSHNRFSIFLYIICVPKKALFIKLNFFLRIHPLFVESMTSNCGFLAFNCPNEVKFCPFT
jgi:hypothetical protein